MGDDHLLDAMAMEMMNKFGKYWRNVEKFKLLLHIANMLDLRYKLSYLQWSFDNIYDPLTTTNLLRKVKSELENLYVCYCSLYGHNEALNKAMWRNSILCFTLPMCLTYLFICNGHLMTYIIL